MGFQISPGVNVSEIDLSTVVPAVGTTAAAFSGVFPWGPTDERTLVTSEVDLTDRFGKPITGYNTETFFTAADFLAYGNTLWVVRVSDGNTAVSSANTATQITAKYPSLVDGAQADDGTNNYLIDKLQDSSRYVTVTDANAATFISELKAYFTAESTEYLAALDGGTNGSDEATIDQASVRLGYDQFKSAEAVDIALVLMGKAMGTSHDAELANYVVQNVCEARKDCIAFISPAREDVVDAAGNEATNVVDFASNLVSSSYGVVDSGYKYRYDKYNDKYIYTPLNGDVAGLCVRTDFQRDPWWSPAGYNRGIIKNVVKIPFNPNKAERDLIYKNRVNPVISQVGQGTFLFGDKTMLSKPSAFDRINVRRLFIVLEKSIALAAKFSLFEFNDEFTRAQFVNLVEPFLRDVEGRRGVYDFRVVCDETNNTPEIIDRNEFVGDIYIKPARSINFIQLNFIAVRTGVEFEEIAGRF